MSSLRRAQCCDEPAPVFIAANFCHIVVPSFVYEQELSLPFGSLVDFKPHSEGHDTVALPVRY